MMNTTRLRTKPKTPRRSEGGQTAWIHLLLLLLAIAFLSSCSPLPGTVQRQTVTPPPSPMPPMQATHQPYRTLTIGLDISGSYPRSVFEQAKHKSADAIDSLVQPNEDGATVYVNWITSNSWSPDSAAMPPVVIPDLPADPQQPTLHPMPTPTGNDPYQDAQAKATIEEENARTVRAYNNLLTQQHATLARVRAEVKRQTDTLRRLEPPVDDISTDIYGFVERASQRLQGSQGVRFLVLATDLDNNDWSQFVQGDINLKNVRVRVIFHYCANAPACASIDAGWRQVFWVAGSRDIRFLDPGQSLAAPSLFS